MQTRATIPPYMRRYIARVLTFMGSYVAILIGSLTFAKNNNDLSQATLIGLALICAFPIIGVFWAVFRLHVEIDDEYQRFLMVKQTLLGTAITLAVVTVWQFLANFHVVDDGPQWVGALWFAMWGIAAAAVRLKA